jgi:hypothetical protein
MEGALGAGEALEGPLKMSVEDPDALKVWVGLECRDAPKECGDFIEGDGHVHVDLQGYLELLRVLKRQGYCHVD